jgi:hypothetical protein
MKVSPVLVLVAVCSACGTPPPPVEIAQTSAAQVTPAGATDVAQAPPGAPETSIAPAPATEFAPSAPAVPDRAASQARPAAPRPRSTRPESRAERSASAVASGVAPSAASKAAEAVAVAAPAPSVPVVREVTLPAGTALDVELTTTVESASSKVEDTVRAKLKTAVVKDGRTVIPAGSELVGTVTEVEQAGRVRGRSRIAFRFTSLRSGGERHDIRTDTVARQGEGSKGEDVTKVGMGAGVGAAIGGLLGGGSGAAKGAAIGGAAGTGAVLATRGAEVRIGAGDAVEARLSAPLTLQVP